MQEVKKIFDGYGNTVYATKTPRGWEIELKLMKERHKRTVGIVRRGVIYMTRKRGKHLLNKLNAYGFSREILERLEGVHTVDIQDEHETFIIPVDRLLAKGKRFKRDERGFEEQIFVKLEDLRGKPEAPKVTQGELF